MVKNKYIPVSEPVISITSKKNVLEAINTGWVSSSGKFVGEFENKFALYVGKKYALAVTSGTAALHIALSALDIGKNDEVIVPAFSMGSVFMSVMYTGAKPVFVDCEEDTFNINPKLIEEKIGKKTKAIIAVHTYGHPFDVDAILKIKRKYGLFFN